MNVLIIKTSSMGDVIHTLPALTDAAHAIPGIQFDWLVEPGFHDIPAWHANIRHVIDVPLRRWRKTVWQTLCFGEFSALRKKIKETKYDAIIDAQGLLKSGWLGLLAKGKRYGYDKRSIREPLASLFYQHKQAVSREQHAVDRIRQLFAQSLGYDMPTTVADYGLNPDSLPQTPNLDEYVMFIHGTTWDSKHWPETYWFQLGALMAKADRHVVLPWGNAIEKTRAEKIARHCDGKATVLPKMSLNTLAGVLHRARAAVAVDTGLGHMAAALNVPTISLYGPTDPIKIGTKGERQMHMAMPFPCAPCVKAICQFQGDSAVKPACFAAATPEKINTMIDQWYT